MIKKVYKRIKSRFTMTPMNFLYHDMFDGKDVWLYVDCYGHRWMANKNYIPYWDARILL